MKFRRSGLSLVIAGLLGGGFFWMTDPRYGLTHPVGENLADAANQAQIGTLVGIVGSAIVLILGVWLLTRRTV
jgi:hypothetical protein